MNKVKTGSVIACILVILVCFIGYTGYASQAVYDVCTGTPEVESCSAKKTDVWPEGYSVDYYGDYEDLLKMEIVEVTWQFTNHTNELLNVNDFWARYSDIDGSRLYTMEKDTEGLAVSGYQNRSVIPSDGHVAYTEYVLVPEGSHEIEVTSAYTGSQQDGGTETFTVTF